MSELSKPDLDDAISRWRAEWAARGEFAPGALDELQDHLTESATDLVACGLDASEAVLVASRRLGKPEELSAELSRVNGPAAFIRPVSWMILGFIVFSLVIEVIRNTSYVIAASGMSIPISESPYVRSWFVWIIFYGLKLAGYTGLVVALVRLAHFQRRRHPALA